MNETALVVGDGWAALSAVGFSLEKYSHVIWLSGTGAKHLPVTASIAAESAPVWMELARRFEVETGDFQEGSFLREFRNKAFHQPEWFTAATEQDRTSVRDEILWQAEKQAAPLREGRFEKTILEIESEIRQKILAHPKLKRIEGISVMNYVESDDYAEVTLTSGEVCQVTSLFFCDSLMSLKSINGLSKKTKINEMMRKWHPMSCVQVEFTHIGAVGNGVQESFFMKSPKEAGDDIDRHVWGYFLSPSEKTGESDGQRSVWTFFLTPEEAEDNHEIGKKLRRIKQCMNKMFSTPEWLPQGKTEYSEFSKTIVSERVTFQENTVFAKGKVEDVSRDSRHQGRLICCPDGFGPSTSALTVAAEFELSFAAEDDSVSDFKSVKVTEETALNISG